MFDHNQIDERHRLWLRSVLLSGHFDRTLEIGSWRGWSTTAFIDALAAGKIVDCHICEPFPQQELLNRIANLRIGLHPETSVETLSDDGAWDFVFIDGDHQLSTVMAEAELLLRWKVPTIMAHDTCNGDPGCEGPQHMKVMLQKAGYLILEDAIRRDGELTHRGMLFATVDPLLLEVGRAGLIEHC